MIDPSDNGEAEEATENYDSYDSFGTFHQTPAITPDNNDFTLSCDNETEASFKYSIVVLY